MPISINRRNKKKKGRRTSIKRGGMPPILGFSALKSAVNRFTTRRSGHSNEFPVTISFSPTKTFAIMKKIFSNQSISIDDPNIKPWYTQLLEFGNEYKEIIKNTYPDATSDIVDKIYHAIHQEYDSVLEKHVYRSMAETFKQTQERFIEEYRTGKQDFSYYLVTVSANWVDTAIAIGLDPLLFNYIKSRDFTLHVTTENELSLSCGPRCNEHGLAQFNEFIQAVESGQFDKIPGFFTTPMNFYNPPENSVVHRSKLSIFDTPCDGLPCSIEIDGKMYQSLNSKLKESQKRSIEAYYNTIYEKDKKGVIIAHQMGTGKTILTISLIELEVYEHMRKTKTPPGSRLKVAVVIPEGIVGSWLEDFRKKCHISNDENDNSKKRMGRVSSSALCHRDPQNLASAPLCKMTIKSPGLGEHVLMQKQKMNRMKSSPMQELEYDLELYGYAQFSRIIATSGTRNYFDDAIIILDEAHRLETERLRISQYIGEANTKIPGLFMSTKPNLLESDFFESSIVIDQYVEVYNAIRRGKRVIAITGTPIYNSMYDMIYLLNLVLNENDMLSFSRKEFRTNFAGKPKWQVFKSFVGDVHRSLVGQILFTTVFSRVKDFLGMKSLTGDLIKYLPNLVMIANPAVAGKYVALQCCALFIEQISKGWLMAERNMTKTYKEDLYLIDDTKPALQKIVRENFLYYNLNDDPDSKKNFAGIVETDVECPYTPGQLLFFVLSKFGVPIATFLKLKDYKLLDKLATGAAAVKPATSASDEKVSSTTLFMNERATLNRERGDVLDDKYMNLAIGNLYFSTKFLTYVELLLQANTLVGTDKAASIDPGIGAIMQQIVDDEQNSSKPNIEWSNKFEEIMKKLKVAVEKGEKSMIYSSFSGVGTELFKEYYDLHCRKYGLTPDMIGYLQDPSTDTGENDRIKDEFNEFGSNSKMKIIVFHPDIMEGMSLQDCMHVHIMECITLKAKYDQVVARARRFNSHANTVTYTANRDPKITVYRYACTSVNTMTHSRNVVAGVVGFAATYKNLNKLMMDSDHFVTAHDNAGVTVTSDSNAKTKFNCLEANDKVFKELLKNHAMDVASVMGIEQEEEEEEAPQLLQVTPQMKANLARIASIRGKWQSH